LPVNHARARITRSTSRWNPASKLTYYEVTNAQHFDSFLAFPGYDTRLVPTHVTSSGDGHHVREPEKRHRDPASQVVRTTPRGGTPARRRDHGGQRAGHRATPARRTRSRSQRNAHRARVNAAAPNEKGRPRPPFFSRAKSSLAASWSSEIFFIVVVVVLDGGVGGGEVRLLRTFASST
jgi:hypothetical protein